MGQKVLKTRARHAGRTKQAGIPGLLGFQRCAVVQPSKRIGSPDPAARPRVGPAFMMPGGINPRRDGQKLRDAASACRLGFVMTIGARNLGGFPIGIRLESCHPLRADCVHGPPQFFDAAAQPAKFFPADPIMFGIARFHIGFLELFKASLFEPLLSRPGIDEATIQPLRLGAQKADVVNMWRLCRAVDYAELARAAPAFCGFARNRLGIVLRFPAASYTE